MSTSEKGKKRGRKKSSWGDEYPSVEAALGLLAGGAVVCAFVVMPGLAHLGKKYFDWKYSDKSEKTIKKRLMRFDRSRLRQLYKRLHDQKDIEIDIKEGIEIVKLTQKGKRKMLKYKLDEMVLDKSRWDGKWRLVSYDIPGNKGRDAREMLRRTMLRLGCKKLHDSLYLTPFPCEEQIAYLREVFGVGEDVVLLVASNIEGEKELKREFGLK